MAKNQDNLTVQRFQMQKTDLDIITKSKQELIDIMPKSEIASSIVNMAPSVAIKESLDAVQRANDKKREILNETVQVLANLNMTEELMKVH
jgi:hypothetical protein